MGADRRGQAGSLGVQTEQGMGQACRGGQGGVVTGSSLIHCYRTEAAEPRPADCGGHCGPPRSSCHPVQATVPPV